MVRKVSLLTMALVMPSWIAGCSTSPSPKLASTPAAAAGAPASLGARMSEKAKSLVSKPKDKPKTAESWLPKPTVAPGADLYVSMAQLQEKANHLDRAAEQYEKALDKEPNHLGALLGYAHLHDRQGKLDEAAKLYEKAVDKHPKEAAAHNDLGLCYARRGMLDKSIECLTKAVELEPKKALYRNNIATVYVEQKRVDEALTHLRAVHAEAVAYYNVAYLLNQRKDTAGAKAHFHMALEKDPSLAPAREWLARLEPQAAESLAMPQPAAVSVERQPTPAIEPAPRANLRAHPVQYPPRIDYGSVTDAPVAPMPEHAVSPQRSEGPALRLLPAVQ